MGRRSRLGLMAGSGAAAFYVAVVLSPDVPLLLPVGILLSTVALAALVRGSLRRGRACNGLLVASSSGFVAAWLSGDPLLRASGIGVAVAALLFPILLLIGAAVHAQERWFPNSLDARRWVYGGAVLSAIGAASVAAVAGAAPLVPAAFVWGGHAGAVAAAAASFAFGIPASPLRREDLCMAMGGVLACALNALLFSRVGFSWLVVSPMMQGAGLGLGFAFGLQRDPPRASRLGT